MTPVDATANRSGASPVARAAARVIRAASARPVGVSALALPLLATMPWSRPSARCAWET